jgi:RsiW-degrading membrane proteinase PrsW (M82 family)
MEEAGMKKVLCNIIIPIIILILWMITCYPVCNQADGFDFFLYWILIGCPYGIRKMCLFLVQKNFGIAGSVGVLALNCIIGGLIGGIIVIVRIVAIFKEIIKIITDHFWTQCPETKNDTDQI